MTTDEYEIDGQPIRQVWRCEPPPEGKPFRVLVDHWNFSGPVWVRCIHEIAA